LAETHVRQHAFGAARGIECHRQSNQAERAQDAPATGMIKSPTLGAIRPVNMSRSGIHLINWLAKLVTPTAAMR